MASELHNILETALGSAEAILLVLFFGYWAQHLGWVNDDGEKQISHLCITVFLPALLFTQIGPHATASNLTDYGIIIIPSAFAMVVSYLVGTLTHRILKGPRWTTAAFIFHNATSLPLLLINSLEKTGTIRVLIGEHGGSVSDAIARGRTYLLIGALVSNVARFALGLEIMSPSDSSNHNANSDPEQRHTEIERTPLLSAERASHEVWPTVQKLGKTVWSWVVGVLNPLLIAAIVAVVFELIPPIRHAFFDHGKFLNATLTQSIDYFGKLYTALQIFALGSKLRSKPGAKFLVLPAIALFFHRFVLMPAIMISVVYLLRAHWPNYVKRDPMLIRKKMLKLHGL
ncbi:hypothetical protein FS749_000806 [Ceratobasidium sp. UAMH 11750]|nr:hypothetical protein FS749_000806 [Ceratobasidium sp. UAMH 11750]